MDGSCTCLGPGYCERFNRQQGDLAHKICSNTRVPPCSENYRAAYLRQWEADKDGTQVRHESTPAPARVPEKHAILDRRGPGTELVRILASLGITIMVDCPCKVRAAQMNAWGIDGCREHFNEIVGWLREGQAFWGWKEKLAAAFSATVSRLAFRLNPLDPFPGLVEEAISRADEKLRNNAGGAD